MRLAFRPGFVFTLLGFLVAIRLPEASPADDRTPRDMIRHAAENMSLKLAGFTRSPLSAGGALDAIRQFYDERRLAQRVIALDYPLDDFTGVLMVDQYDENFIDVVDTLATHFTSHDRTLPSAEAAAVLSSRMQNTPAPGETPAAFIIAYLIGRIGQAASGLPDSLPGSLKSDVAEVAVRLIGQTTAAYRATRSGDLREKAEDFWHRSVIERMLCPNHRSTYAVSEIRNSIKPDGSIFRRYVVACSEGKETRRLDFDLGYLGDMTRSGGRQTLKGRISSPDGRKSGVDP